MKFKLLLREIIFKLLCRHTQGQKDNIFLFANRRSGSTWMLNTIASEKGMRYVGRPLHAMNHGRYKSTLPPSAQADPIILVDEKDLIHFKKTMTKLAKARIEPYPYLNFTTPWFEKKTNRVIYQMTAGIPMIDWFTNEIPATSIWLHRHPIPNALSIKKLNWTHRLNSFIKCKKFVGTFLTGEKVDLINHIISNDLTKNNLTAHTAECCLWSIGPIQSIKNNTNNWKAYSYESLVKNLEFTLSDIMKNCQLNSKDLIYKQGRRPSRNISTESKKEGNFSENAWTKKLKKSEIKDLNNIVKKLTGDFFQK